jgi:single-stranded-DNA-specific exonuclease
MPNEPVYYVDFIWNPTDIFGQDILDIARLEKYIGKDFTEPLVVVQNVEVTKDNIQMMKSNTVKITLPNGVSMIRFFMPDEEFKQLYSENGSVIIDVIGKCTINEWLGKEYPQIKIEDFNVRKKVAYVF